MKKYKIMAFKADSAGCGHYRIDVPFKYLKKNFGDQFELKSDYRISRDYYLDYEKN